MVVHTRLIFTAHNNRSTSESAKLSAIVPADMCAPGPFGTHIYWGDRRVRGRPRSGKSGDKNPALTRAFRWLGRLVTASTTAAPSSDATVAARVERARSIVLRHQGGTPAALVWAAPAHREKPWAVGREVCPAAKLVTQWDFRSQRKVIESSQMLATTLSG